MATRRRNFKNMKLQLNECHRTFSWEVVSAREGCQSRWPLNNNGSNGKPFLGEIYFASIIVGDLTEVLRSPLYFSSFSLFRGRRIV